MNIKTTVTESRMSVFDVKNMLFSKIMKTISLKPKDTDQLKVRSLTKSPTASIRSKGSKLKGKQLTILKGLTSQILYTNNQYSVG